MPARQRWKAKGTRAAGGLLPLPGYAGWGPLAEEERQKTKRQAARCVLGFDFAPAGFLPGVAGEAAGAVLRYVWFPIKAEGHDAPLCCPPGRVLEPIALGLCVKQNAKIEFLAFFLKK